MMQLTLGLGCDRGTSLATLESAIEQALQSVNLEWQQIVQFATIDKKNDEVALLALAEKYNKPLRFFSASALAEVEVPSPSAVVLKYMGTPSVSEAAAILAAKTDKSELVLEKFKMRGADTKNATVSIVMTHIKK